MRTIRGCQDFACVVSPVNGDGARLAINNCDAVSRTVVHPHARLEQNERQVVSSLFGRVLFIVSTSYSLRRETFC